MSRSSTISRPLVPPGARRRGVLLQVVATGIVLLAGTTESARADSARPTLFLHAQEIPPTPTTRCLPEHLGPCETAVTRARTGRQYVVYLLASRGPHNGLAGLQVGLNYNGTAGAGVDISAWHLCGALEFRSTGWPNNGGGNLITFDSNVFCDVETRVAGYFYCSAYSPDQLKLVARPVDGAAKVADCNSAEHLLTANDLGLVRFSADGLEPGTNPCVGSAPPDPGVIIVPANEPEIVLHLTPVVSRNPCANGAVANCATIVTSGALAAPNVGPFYFAYLLGGNAGSLGGVQCGITYEKNAPEDQQNGSGIDIFSWTRCATLEFPSMSPAWPAPGSANLVTWDQAHCAGPGLGVAGYFYLGAYSADRLRLIPRPLDGLAKVANCAGAETEVPEEKLGWLNFSGSGNAPGCNPCLSGCSGPVPVRLTTWGGIKAQFGRQ